MQKPSSGGSQNYIYLHPMVFMALVDVNICNFENPLMMVFA
jgi:hypothetical protein